MFRKSHIVKLWTIFLVVWTISLYCITLMIGNSFLNDVVPSIPISYKMSKQESPLQLGRTFIENALSLSSTSSSSSSSSSPSTTTTTTIYRTVANTEREIPWSHMKNKLIHEGKIRNKAADKSDRRGINQCVRYKNVQLKDDCQIHFNTNKSLPIAALTSYPGSGNTWTRLLLEKATGIFTGAAYNDSVLFSTGNFCGEYLAPWTYKTLCTKTHHPIKEKYIAPEKVTKVILLIRNPYKAVIAHFNWARTHSWTKKANLTEFQSEDWTKLATSFAMWWKDIYRAWLNHPHPVHLVKFEDLKANTSLTVSKMLKYLGYPTMRSHCLQQNFEGSFHRITNCNTTTFNPFTPKLQEIVNRSISLVEKELKNKGFPPLGYDMSVFNC